MFVAWVWSILWYLALDPLRWALSWCLNENGMRNRSTWRSEQVSVGVVALPQGGRTLGRKGFWPVHCQRQDTLEASATPPKYVRTTEGLPASSTLDTELDWMKGHKLSMLTYQAGSRGEVC